MQQRKAGPLDIVSHAFVLDKGKPVHDGTPSSVQESDTLTRVFLGETAERPEPE